MEIRNAVKYFRGMPEVSALYVFGMRRGLLNAERQMGIGLLIDEHNCAGGCDFLEMGSWDISADFPQWQINVVLLNMAPAFVKYHVVRKGSVVFERTQSLRVRFSQMAVDEYLDQKSSDIYKSGELNSLGIELFEVLEEPGP